MNEQQRGSLGRAILSSTNKDVERSRRRHARVLATLGIGLAVAMVCHDCCDWCPRWPAYLLLVMVVFDAVFHACINQEFSEEERQKWQQMLALIDSVQRQTSVEVTTKAPSPKSMKPQQRSGPPLRIFKPDREPPRKGPK